MFRNRARLLGVVCVCVMAFGEWSVGARLLASFCGINYSIGSIRGQAAPLVGGQYYDYSPSTFKDGNLYRMWWCGGVAGDFILYSESFSLDSGWTSPAIVFQPTNQPGTFDERHTCDPSVIRVNGVYYMYYSAAPDASSTNPSSITRIGLATSTNGINWTRANNSQAIVGPAQNIPGAYGSGQQVVTYVNGYFYIRFTDTTGVAGDGQYMMRSPDPTFQTNVEEFRGPGIFNAYNPATHTSHMFFPNHFSGYSADMLYVDATDQFMFSDQPGPNGHTRIQLYDSSLSRKEGEFVIAMNPDPGEEWYDGPTLVGTPDRHAPASGTCGVIPVDIMRSYGLGPNQFNTTGLAHAGADWNTGLGCDCVAAPTLNQPGYNAVGDFNGDNRDDLTSHHRTSGAFNIRLTNVGSFNPDGVFWGSGTTPSSSFGWETLIGDFTGDGFTDYADRHISSGQVWVHRNLQNGTFDSSNWMFGYTAAGPNIEILTGDMDNDGRADLIEHNRKTGGLWIRRNTGVNGTFAPLDVGISYRSQAGNAGQDWRLAVADFNNDGFVDVADFHIPSSQFFVHPGNGGTPASYQFSLGSWSPVSSFLWPGFTTILGDFTGDGWADYADVNRNTGELWVHRSLQNGTFDSSNWAYGVFSLGSGGRWIFGVPVSFP